ncbi:MAG: MFS transporter [Chloroflexi bacterium]|nr:MFS transporter [Chloroflexota bacterium]
MFLRKRPRIYYGWWVVVSTSIVMGLGSVNTLGFTVFFLPLSQELGVSRATFALVRSVSRLEGGLLGPWVGVLIDRFGPRRMLLLGSALAAVGFVLLALIVHSFWSLLVVYVLVLGIAFNAGFFPACLAAVNTWFARRRALAMSTVNAAWGGAGFVIVPLLSFLILRYGWRTAAMFSAVLMACSLLPPLLMMRHRDPESLGVPIDGGPVQRQVGNPERAAVAARERDFTTREATRTPAFWLMIVAQTLRAVSYSAILVHFHPLLVWKGLSYQGAANLVGLWSLLVIPASVGLGLISDRWSKKLVLSSFILVAAAAYLLLGLVQHALVLWLFIFVLAPFDNLGIINSALIGEFYGRKAFGTLRGISAGAGSLLTAASPAYAGWVYDRTQSYASALVPFGVMLVVAAAIYAFLPRPRLPAPRAPAPSS